MKPGIFLDDTDKSWNSASHKIPKQTVCSTAFPIQAKVSDQSEIPEGVKVAGFLSSLSWICAWVWNVVLILVSSHLAFVPNFEQGTVEKDCVKKAI